MLWKKSLLTFIYFTVLHVTTPAALLRRGQHWNKSHNFRSWSTFVPIYPHKEVPCFCFVHTNCKLGVQRIAPIACTFERITDFRAILQEALLPLSCSQSWGSKFQLKSEVLQRMLWKTLFQEDFTHKRVSYKVKGTSLFCNLGKPHSNSYCRHLGIGWGAFLTVKSTN